MKTLCFVAIVCAGGFATSVISADQWDEYREVQRIVVITQDEGIHYASFCGFYELRDILAESLEDLSENTDTKGPPYFEVRAIGRNGELTAYVGDHWIRTESGAALMTISTHQRLIELVDMREGSGVPLSKVTKSIERAARQIQDPAYIEQDMCDSR